ncbi:hypothetical protein ACLOJK_013171 [Asimina triloba]
MASAKKSHEDGWEWMELYLVFSVTISYLLAQGSAYIRCHVWTLLSTFRRWMVALRKRVLFGFFFSVFIWKTMSSPSAQLATLRRMGVYEPNHHQIGMWGQSVGIDSIPSTGESTIIEDETKPENGVLRRLAQNREAARKSRLRKKAYVQQLESSRLKLAQLEQELERARQQGAIVGGQIGDSSNLMFGGSVSSAIKASIQSKVYAIYISDPPIVSVGSPGVVAFELEYGHWVEEQNRQIHELRTALQAQVSDFELRILVENGLNHYDDLFRMKTIAAKTDVFFLMSGMWRTAAERCFLWIGGFRPSEVLKVLRHHLDPLTDKQVMDVYNLQQSSQQAEDALSQGMDKLQQTLAEAVASENLGVIDVTNYMGHMATAMGKLEALESFVNQADHLRRQTMRQMYLILTPRQAARGLLALGDYFQRLRALSSLWAARPREPG